MKTPSESSDIAKSVPGSSDPPVLEGERLAWLALTMTGGLGPTRIWRAVNAAGTALGVLGLPLTQLEGLRLPASSAQSIFSGKSLAEAEKEWKRVQEGGGTLVTPVDEEYPQRLREISTLQHYYGYAVIKLCWRSPGLQLSARVIPRRTALGWQRCWLAIWLHMAW